LIDGWTSEADAWNTEYKAGRYEHESSISFVSDILAAATSHDLANKPGLYVGCGNGRNYLPLVEGGLDLIGLDISSVAIDQLCEKIPERRSKLVAGDLSALPADAVFQTVIGIQVFQHGDRHTAHQHILAAQERVAPGGIFCLRVNAIGSDIEKGIRRRKRMLTEA
jgi:SAM-dependent methyltransferase